MKFIPEPIAEEHRTPYPRIDLYGPKPAEGSVSEIEPYVTTAVADHIWDAVVHTARGTNPPPLVPRIEPTSTSESASEESAAPTQPTETIYWTEPDGEVVSADVIWSA